MAVPTFSVSQFLASINQTLEYAYPTVSIEGEVASFKINQSKYVFFDLKDESGTVGCFMTVWQMRTPIEDGMKIVATVNPKVTPWGKFSLTVQSYRPSGEGSLKKSFDLLKAKLDKEGLFSPERKRSLPRIPQKIGVISSTGAAGYADFIKILNERWGGLEVSVAHTQVQGDAAPDQMIRALRYFNTEDKLADVLVMIRGGGSLDDLSAYNDERLVREIAGSRVPVLVGVGHEVDITLADLAADRRAATPSSAAQILVPDRQEMILSLRQSVRTMAVKTEQSIDQSVQEIRRALEAAADQAVRAVDSLLDSHRSNTEKLRAYDPVAVMRRGYSIVRGQLTTGATIDIETINKRVIAEVTDVKTK